MEKPLFNKICIVGVGLMGGSLAMAIKKRGLANEVLGVIRRPKKAEIALKMQVIDKPLATIPTKQDIDLIILCSPITDIISKLKTLHIFLSPKTLVIDVGSSKKQIVNVAQEYLDKNRPESPKFVGCHPMAGKEKKGFEFADPDLFENAYCFITGDNSKIDEFWTALGAIPWHIDADSHDIWAAQVSHLPHLIAFALFKRFEFLGDIPMTNKSIQEFARLSSSDPQIWTDVLMSNKEETLKALRDFQDNLNKWQAALASNNEAEVLKMIVEANKLSFDRLIWKQGQHSELPPKLLE